MVTPTTPARRISLIIRFDDGTFAGSPLTVRTRNKQLAGVVEPEEAEQAAKELGGTVVEFPSA